MALWNAKLIAIFNSATYFFDIREVNMWIDTLAEHIEAKCYKANISSALTISKKSSFNAIGSSKVAKFGCRNTSSAIVVWMQRENDAIAIFEIAMHPFNRICINVWRCHFHSRRKIHDGLPLWSRLPNIVNRVTHFQRVLEFSTGV